MRLQVLAVGLCASTLLSGCGLVLGISSGEYDPDPFGLAGGAGGAGGSPAPWWCVECRVGGTAVARTRAADHLAR